MAVGPGPYDALRHTVVTIADKKFICCVASNIEHCVRGGVRGMPSGGSRLDAVGTDRNLAQFGKIKTEDPRC